MTTIPAFPVIRTPSALIACCSPILGFEPDDCVVAFINGVGGRRSPVVARADLGAGEGVPERAAALASGIVGTGGTEVHLVAWSRSVPDEARRSALLATPMLCELELALAACGVPVGLAVTTNGRVSWRHCEEADCCQEAQGLDSREILEMRAEFVYAGYAPLASREALEACLEPDPERVQEVARLLRAPSRPRGSELGRVRQIRDACRLLVPTVVPDVASPAQRRASVAPLPAATCARLLRALVDLGVRDSVLLQLVRSEAPDEQWSATCNRLADLVRCAPEGRGAGAATLLAVSAWMRGDGALGSIALGVACRHDPDYRLAGLVGEVIRRGIDPVVWRDGFEDLTEARCLAATVSPGQAFARARDELLG